MRIIAATAGASLGDIETACILPTSSSCGTDTFSTAMSVIQPMMMGTASRRIHLAMPDLRACSARVASVAGALTRPSSPQRAHGHHNGAPL
jgi:hypothetical protein